MTPTPTNSRTTIKEKHMSVMTDLRNTVDTTPFFAAVGATDLAVEKVREARVRADKVRADFSADLAPAKVQARATTLVEGVKEIPAVVINETLVVGGKVAEGYDELALRGKNLVTRIRNQKATKDLFAQAETSVAQAKGAVTSARNAAADIERSAKATITTGRNEAVKLAEIVTGSVIDEAKSLEAEVTESAKRTRTAAKRTTTTTKNASKKAVTSAKAATTSARNTAAAAEKATEKAAEKVGDVPATKPVAKRTATKRTVKVSTKPAAKTASKPAAKPAGKPAAAATVTVTA
jgi:heparin binding hemagglutinin HbhA